MESVGRTRKCLSRKYSQKPHKQLTQLKVSQSKFARLLSGCFSMSDICYGAANKVLKQDLKNGQNLDNNCSKDVLGNDIFAKLIEHPS